MYMMKIRRRCSGCCRVHWKKKAHTMAVKRNNNPYLIIQVMPKLAVGSFSARWIISTSHARSWHIAMCLASKDVHH